ncbi:MAG: zinc-ribbon domain-containing protein [Clostridia bacterium]|nr:zinc-ribbon domain-containing protein [Clostridia bacterium]
MFCKQCGAQLGEGTKFCQQCGTPTESVNETPAQQPAQPQYSQPNYQFNQPQQNGYVNNNNVYSQPLPGKGTGIPSLILGILSLVILPFICSYFGIIVMCVSILFSIVALVLGIVSNHTAKRVGRRNGMATAGIVCSSISLGLNLVLVILVVLAAMGLFYYRW